MTNSDLESQIKQLLGLSPSLIVEKAKSRFDELAGSYARYIVLFGAGSLGLRTLRRLRTLGIEPLAFSDNNPLRWGTTVEGVHILPPQDAIERFNDKAVFVVTIYNGSAVRQQLHGMNCSRVAPYAYLFWKYSGTFLPYCAMDLPHTIFEQADRVNLAFSLMGDNVSKHEYIAQLRWHLLLDFDALSDHLPQTEIYFPQDLFELSDDEVFVDCGAFDGDSVRDFLRRRGKKFKGLIAFEPDADNFASLQKYVNGLDKSVRKKIVLKQLATAAKRGFMDFNATGTGASTLDIAGKNQVQCAPLDDALANFNPTFIKMDIEGGEYDSLMGSDRIIKEERPIWAICLYHRQSDLWQVPLLINSYGSGYRFFLRRYAEDCWETVCYAIPLTRQISRG